MKILITGSSGFVGKNLKERLKNIRDGKDRTSPELKIDEIYEYDVDSSESLLDEYCKNADFVFHLAGINRPKNSDDFFKGNTDFTSDVLNKLKKYKNNCPVMYSSSIQAELENDYGKSKRAGEELVFAHSAEIGARALVYRFPNLFGKWCRPNYNSVIATFCNNIANDLPIQISDRDTMLTLVYIDDLVDEMINALRKKENHSGKFCSVAVEHKATLGEIADLLYKFASQSSTLIMPEIPKNSFAKKLYSTYLSYLPERKIAFPLKMNCDERGSFTEIMKTESLGQFSVNISKPSIVKGQHWHNTKWEFFIVVSGKGLIRMRKIGSDEVLEFYVSGEKIEAVHMLPGYTHNIINLSKTEDLVTVMWANEMFDKNKPDTFFEEV